MYLVPTYIVMNNAFLIFIVFNVLLLLLFWRKHGRNLKV